MNKQHQFAALLKESRKKIGFSQSQIAQKCYLSKSCYNHFEQGKRLPSVETLIRICSILNINPLELLCIIVPDDIKEENPTFDGFLLQNNNSISKSEISFLNSYKKLCDTEQKAVLDIIESLLLNHES